MASKTHVLLVKSLNSLLLSLLFSNAFVVVHCFQSIVPFAAHHHPLSKTLLHSSVADTTDEQPSAAIVSGPPAITARELTCSFDGGDTYQLQSASYILPRGGRVGLVGRNGCGKSTFLRILAEACGYGSDNGKARDNVPFTGEVECPRDVTVAFVEQEPPSPSGITVADALLGVIDASSKGVSSGKMSVYEVVQQYRIASLNAATDPDAFSAASTLMDTKDGWSVLTKADEVSTKLRVKQLENQPLSSLSGGERKRVALAAALVREPDVLILDEPTNHLDLAAIRWLSDLLREKKKMTLLTVTHDRAFLGDVCSSILELDRGSFYSYEGDYAAYLQGKEERLANEDKAYSEAKAMYKKELSWMRRQPQGRQTKQKARQQSFYQLEKSTKPRVKDPALELSDEGQRRLGGNILKMRNVSLSFGDKKMLDDFSYDFNKGDRIGIVGRNGVGKSTFIRSLYGDQSIDSGTIESGETVVFGVYDQMGIPFLDEEQTCLEFVKERVEAGAGKVMGEAPQEAMKMLKQFQFPRNRWPERVSMLSGGERRRLQLLSVLAKRPNFLILDEPTNDVDLDSLRALETYLEDYKGVLVIVSHDRSFTDTVTNHLFVFEGNGIVNDYLGSLSDYAECLIEQENKDDAAAGPVSTEEKAPVEDKATRVARMNSIKKMKKDFAKIEPLIEKLKAKAAELQSSIDSSSDEGWTVLADLTDNLNKVEEEIEEKELEWLELAEQLEELE